MAAKVLVADPIASDGVEMLRAHAEVDVKTGLSPAELIDIVGEYDALVVRSETRATAEVIEAGKKLQVIGRAGVGVDNIDLEAATRRGIVVVNVPTGNTISATEHTLALMLALARYIPQANTSLKSGMWERANFIGIELRDKTLGVVGLGRVGSEVARRAKAMEMRVVAYDPFVSMEHAHYLGVEMVTLDELLKQSDFISLHTPLTSQTRNMIGAKQLALVKPTVRFINCARGNIIDEGALLKAIEEGRVAGAAIDVFSEEPMTDSPLFKSDKIIVTPHLAASTAEAQTNVALGVAEQVIAVLNGEPARYAVNAPLFTQETISMIAPFLEIVSTMGKLVTQLAEGQLETITIKYEGEIANYDTSTLKAAIIGGLLEPITEERVNLVNANFIAQSRGLKIIEQKGSIAENYANLVTVEATTSAGTTTVAGTLLRGEPHIVRINSYWIDLVPTGGYWLFSDHRDRPGLIGTVGNITGNADINISSMQVSRLKPRGQALMVLGLDEPLPQAQQDQLLAIPDVYTVKVVKL